MATVQPPGDFTRLLRGRAPSCHPRPYPAIACPVRTGITYPASTDVTPLWCSSTTSALSIRPRLLQASSSPTPRLCYVHGGKIGKQGARVAVPHRLVRVAPTRTGTEATVRELGVAAAAVCAEPRPRRGSSSARKRTPCGTEGPEEHSPTRGRTPFNASPRMFSRSASTLECIVGGSQNHRLCSVPGNVSV